MKIGLCLEGGGSKGAYQAGVIKALVDGGIGEFYSVAGTSIGAMNGYFLYTDNIDKMVQLWTDVEKNGANKVRIIDNTVDNSPMIRRIEGIYSQDRIKIHAQNLYVNYVEVENKEAREVVVNLANMSERDCLEAVKYSSLLPHSPNSRDNFRDAFLRDLETGIYDGFKLDGGTINNRLIEPIIADSVDKIILITMRSDYILQDKIKEVFPEENVFVIRPKIAFAPEDTFKFRGDFCRVNYYRGYDIGKEFVEEVWNK
ncbi:MAG: patatin-like phospholipase family protein [Clostridioides sp.]|nr:patatin-like phospholipase family protein [Clostridioides sp.]